MKKILFVLTALFVCGLAVMSCASDKKSKKNPINSITVEVTPSFLGEIIASSPTHTLTAVVKNNGVVIANAPVNWVVNPSAQFGSCSPNPAPQTVFTADMTASGQGSIVASYNGVNSAPVQFSIKEAPLVIDSIAITPDTSQNITGDQTIVFTATAKSGTTTVTTVDLNWTVTGPGTISPNPCPSGYPVTFNPSGAGNASVKASYGAIDSSVVNIVITSTEPPVNRYLIYSDAGLGAGVCTNYGKYQSPGADSTMNEIMPGSPEDSSKAQKMVYTVTGSYNTSWAGWYMLFGSSLLNPIPVDMSQYSKLTIWLKGENGGEKVGIEVENSAGGKKREYYTLTSSWTKYELDISSIKSSPIKVPLNIVFAGDSGCVPCTIYFDFVSFE